MDLKGTIPQWLIVIVVIAGLGVILERLHVAKTPVNIWGLQLTQGVEAVSLTQFDVLDAHNPGQCKADTGTPGRQCTQPLGKQILCFLMHVNENELLQEPQGWTSCTLNHDSDLGKWSLVARAAVCQAGCIDLIQK